MSKKKRQKELDAQIERNEEAIRANCYAAGYIQGKFDQGGYEDEAASDDEYKEDIELARIQYHEDFAK